MNDGSGESQVVYGKEGADLFGQNMKHQSEGRGGCSMIAPDRIQEWGFVFNTKDNCQSLWGLRKEK